MRFVFVRSLGWAKGLGIVLILGAFAVCLYAIWLLSTDARRELDLLATARGDSLQWSLTQAEVEQGTLAVAALSATADDPESLRNLRRRFDIFYSRIAVLRNAAALSVMREDPELSQHLQRVNDFLETYVPAIDGSDADLAALLPELTEDAQALRNPLRSLSLAGVGIFAAAAEEQRENVAKSLLNLASALLLLILLLAGLVVMLIWLLALTRRQTAEIDQTRDRLSSIVETSRDAVVVIGSDSRIVEVNSAASRIFGFERKDALGKCMPEMIIPEEARSAHFKAMRQYRQTGVMEQDSHAFMPPEAIRRDGTRFPIELSLSTARSGEEELFIFFIRDISDRVAAEKELVETRDLAIQGEKAKADLLAVMSHEMRTPLNGILGTLDLLSTTGLTARQQRLTEVMDTSAQMLLRHVNDVLDVSRMEAETSMVHVEPFNVVRMVRSLADSLRGQAEARGNTIFLKVLGRAPGRVLGDKARLEQVLVNLLSNAIRFTENGTITIEIEACGSDEMVEFRVIDTGIGIPEEDQERIFEDFVRLDTSYARSTEGTGLGLAIVRRLTAMLGGEIGVESEVDEGSVFWVRLPLPPARSFACDEESDPKRILADGQGRRVLLVEDNEVNRLVAREMLQEFGCEVQEAIDGEEGVARARREPFDLILMDINMPKLDGVEATRRILDAEEPTRATPIVAITAHTLPQDLRRFREAGVSDVLVKPVSRQALGNVLARFFGQAPQISPLEAAERDRATGKRFLQKALSELESELSAASERLTAAADPAALGSDIHRMAGLAGLAGLTEAHGQLADLEGVLDALTTVEATERLAEVRATLRAARAAA